MTHFGPLARAWVALIALTALSTAVALAPAPSLRLGLGVAILILALVKARVILGRYLDLDDYPGARRVFTGILVAWGAAALGLYLAAG